MTQQKQTNYRPSCKSRQRSYNKKTSK